MTTTAPTATDVLAARLHAPADIAEQVGAGQTDPGAAFEAHRLHGAREEVA
jgi:hypothetical protein